MFERFTEDSVRSVKAAQTEARSLRHAYIGTEHLLLGILSNPDSRASRLLAGLGVNAERVRTLVVHTTGIGDTPSKERIPFTVNAKQALGQALRVALRRDENYIDVTHLLLGLIADREFVATAILAEFGVTPEMISGRLPAPAREPAERQESAELQAFIVTGIDGPDRGAIVWADDPEHCAQVLREELAPDAAGPAAEWKIQPVPETPRAPAVLTF